MNYEEAMIYIEQVNQKGSVYGLDRVKELERRMGHPSGDLKIIHVTGTNGKGSFCTFLANILKEAGYKVGRFISPTIFDYRERISQNGIWISEEQVAHYITRIQEICALMIEDGFDQPTSFEIETVMAFMYFKDMGSDPVILEVGMGGAGDSTNMISAPMLSVITSISLDHTAILGTTVEAIAQEKAGIIKGNPAMIYSQDTSVMDVIRHRCKLTGSDLDIVDFSSACVHEQTIDGQTFDYGNHKDLHIQMLGVYQIYNACAAVHASDLLCRMGYEIPPKALDDGIGRSRWAGRFEVIASHPTIVVDGAHNPAGAKSLAESLDVFFDRRRKVLIAGIFADKDYQQMLRIMSETSDTIIVHRPKLPRGLDARTLAVTAQKYFRHVSTADSLKEALAQAKAFIQNDDDVIVSFGSLSTVKELYEII